jgi:hypothetical protein
MEDLPTAPAETPEATPLTDATAQRFADERYLYQMLSDARAALAQSKVNKLLAQQGLLDFAPGKSPHPNQFSEAITEAQRLINTLVAEIASLGPEGIHVTTLDVVAGLP